MADLQLTLITRRDCHLCEEMAAVIDEVKVVIPVDLEVWDVDATSELRERYGEEVPVLLVNGRKAFKYRVTVRELERRLQAESRRTRAGGWRRLLRPGG